MTVSIFNALDTPGETECRRELRDFLDLLDCRYGQRPSLLAVRADFATEDPNVRKQLYADAYALAIQFDDPMNVLFICHSMCELCVEIEAPVPALTLWLHRLRTHLDSTPDHSMEREYQRLQARIVGHGAAGGV